MVIGSYLCVWHWAQAMLVPIHTAMVVFTRSMMGGHAKLLVTGATFVLGHRVCDGRRWR